MQSLGRLSLAMEELSECDSLMPHLSILLTAQNSVEDATDATAKLLSSDADAFVDVSSSNHAVQAKRHYDDLHSLPDSPTPQSSHSLSSLTQTDMRSCNFASDDTCSSLPRHSVTNHFENGAARSKENLMCTCKKLENTICKTNNSAHLENFALLEPSVNYAKPFSIQDVDISSVRLSSTSVGSSSSSSSGIGQDLGCTKTASLVDISSPPLYSGVACSSPPVGSIPSASSGAIPKSISFDKSAERGDKVLR